MTQRASNRDSAATRRKRKNVEGSVIKRYRRVNGERRHVGWYASLYIPDVNPDNPKRRIRRSFATKEEAELGLKALKDEMKGKNTEVVDREQTKVIDYLHLFNEKTLPILDLSDSRKDSYRQLTSRPLKQTLGNVKLVNFPRFAKDWMAELARAKSRSDETLSGATQRKAFYVLKRVLDEAVTDGYMTFNPLDALDPPRQEKPDVPVTDPDTFDKVIRPKLIGNTLEPIVMFVAHTGTRMGEARGLKWQDVDLDLGTATIRVSGPTTDRTKSSKIRTVPLPPELVTVLKIWRMDQKQLRLAAGADWKNETGLVFTDSEGDALEKDRLFRAYAKFLAELGVPSERPFHSLRHSYAHRWLRDGKDIYKLSAILGHANINMTLNTYGHVRPMDYADEVHSLFPSTKVTK